MAETAKPSTWTLDAHDRVFVVEFSPYNWCGSLIAWGSRNRITIGQCSFPEEDADVDGLEFEPLRDFHHGTRVDALSWSPQTSLAIVPRVVKLASAGSDYKVRVFTSDLKAENTVQEIEGHTDYINAIAFEPDKGNQLASVSDDHTCRIWALDGSKPVCFHLQSPGMSVGWHSEDQAKLLVAEKSGIVRFYNVITLQPIMSLDCNATPLMSADWCSGNHLKVGCVAASEWFEWEMSQSSRPVQKFTCHRDGGRYFRWSRTNENLLATIGRPGTDVKVYYAKSDQVCLASRLSVAGGLSWHHKLPVIAVGGDRKVHFWVVEGF